MQEKIDILLIQYNKFMDKLISEVKELQMRKSLELSMLWLRELA